MVEVPNIKRHIIFTAETHNFPTGIKTTYYVPASMNIKLSHVSVEIPAV